jgi:hypothetical protein
MSARAPPHRSVERYLGRDGSRCREGAEVVAGALQTSKRLAIGGDGSEFAGLAGVRRRTVGGSASTIKKARRREQQH